jgi:hypothetical protein
MTHGVLSEAERSEEPRLMLSRSVVAEPPQDDTGFD